MFSKEKIKNHLDQSFVDNFEKIESLFDDCYNDPQIDPIRIEICYCISIGLGQASITLTNHLFESAVKHYLIVYSSRINQNPDSFNKNQSLVKTIIGNLEKAIDRYNSSNLNDNIDDLYKLKLLTITEKKELKRLKDDFRNAYSHSDKKKTFKSSMIRAQGVKLSEHGFELEKDEIVSPIYMPIGQGIYQKRKADKECFPYFLTLHQIIKTIRVRVYGEIQNHFPNI